MEGSIFNQNKNVAGSAKIFMLSQQNFGNKLNQQNFVELADELSCFGFSPWMYM